MSEWHLDDLRAALINRGWRILQVHPGDDYAVSGSWEIQRSTRVPPLWIDFEGLDDLRTLPMDKSYGCHVRGGPSSLYFRRPGGRWQTELEKFVTSLDAVTSTSGDAGT